MEGTSQTEKLKAALRLSGRRITTRRLEVLEAVVTSGAHKSAEELCEELRGQVGRATVFRALKLLTELGLAARTGLAGRVGFEAAGTKHHDHIICVRCGRIEEFYNPEIEALQNRELKKRGFRPVSHSLEISGICRKCAGRKAK